MKKLAFLAFAFVAFAAAPSAAEDNVNAYAEGNPATVTIVGVPGQVISLHSIDLDNDGPVSGQILTVTSGSQTLMKHNPQMLGSYYIRNFTVPLQGNVVGETMVISASAAPGSGAYRLSVQASRGVPSSTVVPTRQVP